ncbi:hypothetical protein BV501_12825 [Erwinia sp. OAMSP11]|nr:hypothetical protein BV501_12825 [Erwinia sp. OAMSP11]
MSDATAFAKQGLAQDPHPVPYLHTQGLLPHQGIRDLSIAAEKDLHVMRNAALIWRATGDKKWLKVAHQYLMAWVKEYKPSYDPIDETGFESLIDSYAITKNAMPAEDRKMVESFLKKWGDGYISSIQHADNKKTWINNWQSHRIKIITMIAVAIDDKDLFDKSRYLFTNQLSKNIMGTGEPIDFIQRDALHYVVYDIEPLVQAALAAKRFGENWYLIKGDNGGSVKKALLWLAPYAAGEKRHKEFVHSHAHFDQARAQAGIKGFKGMFNRRTAAKLYWMATGLDNSWRTLAKNLSGKPPVNVSMCGL